VARVAGRARERPPHGREGPRAHPITPLKTLYVEYGLGAVGLVPHMVFLVDFVARGLGRGLAAGAGYWVLFGLAATVGPVLAGRLADRIGFGPALHLAFLVQAVAVALLVVADGAGGLALSSIVIAAFVPGIVPLVLGRVQELAGPDERGRTVAWSIATVAFALGQAGAAYGFSFLFARTGSYTILFALGAAALILALVIDLAANRATSPRSAAV
jgi:predicted MFS family arabinose efflux permease